MKNGAELITPRGTLILIQDLEYIAPIKDGYIAATFAVDGECQMYTVQVCIKKHKKQDDKELEKLRLLKTS